MQVKELSLPPTPLPGLVAVPAESGVCVCLEDKGCFAVWVGVGWFGVGVDKCP